MKQKPDLNPVSSPVVSTVDQPEVQITGEKTLRAILSDGEDCAMIMTDPTGLVITWNKAAETIFGYTENEIVGKSIAYFYLPGNIESGEHSDNLLQAAQAPDYFTEGWRVKKDGTKFWAYVSYTPLYDFSRRLLGFANTIRELTENKYITDDEIEYGAGHRHNRPAKVIEKKITRDARFRKLIENSYEGITLLDKDFKTIFRSLSAKRINGWSNAERTKQSMIDRVHPDDKEWMASLSKEVLKNTGVTIPCTYRVKHFDGHYIWVQSTFTNHLDDPEIGAIVLNFRNISEERELQTKQQQMVKELRERNDFIETVLYNLPIGILVNRSDNRKVTLINKQFSEIYDCKEDDLNDYSEFFKKIYPNKTHREDLAAKIIHDVNEGDAAKLLFENTPLITSKGKKKIVNAKIIPLYDQNLMISTIMDVTDEYNQSKELKRIKANQDAIINDTENLVWSVDTNLRIITANKRYVEFVKANAGQHISEGDMALIQGHGEERTTKWKDYYERALFGESLTFKEEIFDHRTNSVQYGLVSLNPMYNTEGKIFGASCNIKNITGDTLNLIALERAKNDLEKMMNASLDIICTIDDRSYFLNVNAAAEAILGYKPEELIGKSVYSVIYPEDREKTKIASAGLMEGHDLVNFECRYVRKNGSIVYLTSSSKWDPNDRVSYGVARDVSERKKAEEAIVDSEKKYRLLFENNPLPLLIWDFETLQIIDCNIEAEIKYGYSREEFLNLTLKDIRPPEDVPLLDDFLNNEDDIYGPNQKRIWRHKKKNGEIMFVKISGHLMNYDGKKVSLALTEDVTESHYYQELDKLEKNILEMNTWSDSNLETVLKVYLSGIESIHPGMLCSIRELRGKKLYNMASPSLPGEYLDMIDGIETGSEMCPCAASAFLKQSTIVSDIFNDIQCTRCKEITALYQLKACWSQPILDSKGNVLATLASYFREIKAPSKSEENTIQRAAQILQLILESYQRELSLKVSNERFQYVAAATSQVIWDWNLATDEVYFSENFEKTFGYPSGSSRYDENFFKNLVHPDDRAKVMLSAAEVNFGQITNLNHGYRFKKANGEYAFVLDKALVIRDKNGLGMRMVGAMEDITKQKQEEQHLKLLESVVTNSSDAVMITKAGTADDPGLHILYVNEAFTKMTGYFPEEVIGKTPAFLQGPKSSVSELNRLMEALRTMQPCEISTINYKKNGEEFWINFSVVPVADENGSFTHWIAIQRDITKHQNEELQKELLLQISQIFKEDIKLLDCIEKALKRLLDYGNFSLVEFLLVDNDQKKINLIAKVSETDEMQAFTNETAEIKYFQKGEGMPGIAWKTKCIQEWRINESNSNFKRIESAKKHGIKRAYALPIMNNDEVIGVLTLGMDRDEMPDFGFATMFDDFSKTFAIEIRRKQAEEELNGIFNFSPDIICVAGTDGYFKKINPAASHLLGYTMEELLSRPFFDFVYPDDLGKTYTEFDDVSSGRQLFYFENRYITKYGKIVWLAWTSTLATVDGLIFSVAKDITEKKEFEDLLNKATKLARIGAWEVDFDKIIVHWSDIMHEIHETEPNFTPDIKTALGFFEKGENQEKITKVMQDAYDHGTPADLELQIITAKGNIKWVRAIVETEFINGRCLRLYGSFQDIDAMKKAEIAVRKALEERNSVLESIGDAFFAVDEKWVVTYWNNMAEKVLHVSVNDILGHNLWELFADSINSVSFKKYHEAVETNQAVHFEDYYPVLTRWYEISAYPSETGLSVYFKDITDRKTSETRLQELNASLRKQARELTISNAELEQFAYVASHDLQEPLRMVTSFMTQLERKYGDVVDDKGKQYIHFAVDGAKRMRQIILDLLEFSKVGKNEDGIEDVNLNTVISEIQALFRKQIEEKHAKIAFHNLPTIQTYKTPLRQVLQNLISNSLKYQKKGVMPVISISASETQKNWHISVKDNGIGIDADYFDKIFIIFQRLHSKDEYTGSGMGLAITKKIVENLGGKIWVESELGQGSTFYFTVPKSVKQ